MKYGLQIVDVWASYEERSVLSGIHLTLYAGEIGCLLGESGSGKTTLLRCIAGLERIDKGVITIGDNIVAHAPKEIPIEDRPIGFVFQDYALFPHMTVYQNIAFAKPIHGTKSVEDSIHLCRLAGLEKRYPFELSGGQQQRVAIARALMRNPKVLLLDEPFSNLDLQLRDQLMCDLKDLLQQLKMTCLMVTHDPRESFAMADRMGAICNGKLLQWHHPEHIYHQPGHAKVAKALGHGLLLPAIHEGQTITSLIGAHHANHLPPAKGSTKGFLFLRPEDLQISNSGKLPGKIVRIWFRGSHYHVDVRLQDDCVLRVSIYQRNYALGDEIFVNLKPGAMPPFLIDDGYTL